MNPHEKLPKTWVWTRRGKVVENGILYFARDTTWDPSIPDLVSTSESDTIQQAWECYNAEREI